MKTLGVVVVVALAGCQTSSEGGDRGASPSKGQAMYVPGAGSQLMEQMSCTVMADLLITAITPGQDGQAETTLQYTYDNWANGDQSCTCTAYSVEFMSSRAGGSMMSKIGTEDGTCDAPIDYPPYPEVGLSGRWRFQSDDGAPPVAQYIDLDPGHLVDGTTVMFEAKDCVMMRADESGMLVLVEAAET